MNKSRSATRLSRSVLNLFRTGREASGEPDGAKPGPAGRKSCELRGRSYSHGSEIAEGAGSLECVNGEWKERSNVFLTAGPWRKPLSRLNIERSEK